MTTIQIALDVTDIEHATRLGQSALEAGADWLEIGKPFVEFNGIRGARALVEALPQTYWLMDLMVMAAPQRYLDAARELGVANVTVTALAPLSTVETAIAHGRDIGIEVTVDLFNVTPLVENARRIADLGPDYLMVHYGVDQKRHAPQGSPLADLARVVGSVGCPVSYATYDSVESRAAVSAGASVIVQGEPLLSLDDPGAAIADFVTATRAASSGPQARSEK